ncbi:MAG TPA: hypothetical protein VJU15_10575 [Gemmatimonadales bacterium]|nr:hypothetical protein [Gemmatimonadales bacterium]
MSNVPVSVALGLIAALVANPTVWTAKLDGKDGSKISGTARVETIAPVTPPRDSAMPPATPMSGADEVRVTVTVNGAAPNSTLSWNLRSGECSAKVAETNTVGGATGSIKVDGQGSGTATSQVKATLPAGGDLHIAVNDGGKVAACGDLEASKTSTEE